MLRAPLRPLPEHDFYSLAPALVNSHKFPFNFRRQIAQQRIGRGTHMRRWCDEKQQRFFAAFEISKAGKFASGMMPLDSRPIVQTLERQAGMFLLPSFQHCEPVPL